MCWIPLLLSGLQTPCGVDGVNFLLTILSQPVSFLWLERKVKEWGCMQALIDYDGWRKWKAFGDAPSAATPAVKKIKEKEKEKEKSGESESAGEGGGSGSGSGSS